jgi:uncharacterized protein (DUF488 family)
MDAKFGASLNPSTIYSIGHGTKKIEVLIEELHSFEIDYLIDIRTVPYSRFNPQYRQPALKASVEAVGIQYVYLGHQLGGRSKDESVYVEGKVRYDLVMEKPWFQEGIQRLVTANEKGIRVAILCSESKPEDCHRSRLVGKALLRLGISVRHIVGVERVEMQEELVLDASKEKDRRKSSDAEDS